MAAGLPVVASRIGQLKNLIEEGRNGLLVTPGDAAGLAAALERLQSDPELRARLGQAARSTVLEQYTWDAVAQRVLCLAGLEATPHAEGAALRN
jgi:glycosyltransferase involved in cell wall biosynthesis